MIPVAHWLIIVAAFHFTPRHGAVFTNGSGRVTGNSEAIPLAWLVAVIGQVVLDRFQMSGNRVNQELV
jgi:hypothetical protein